MRSVGKFVVKVFMAICVLICSRAVLAVAHALGWYPEIQLANLILAAPTAIQTEVVMWGMLAFLVFVAWLLTDAYAYRRDLRRSWRKIRLRIVRFDLRKEWRKGRAKAIRLFRKRVTFPQTEPPPVVENAPGLVWKWVKSTGRWEARWCAPKLAVTMGYPTRYARLWQSVEPGQRPSEMDCHYIADCCRAMQDQRD